MIKIIPVFLPFYGCRNRCIYCNQNIITANKNISPEIAFEEILLLTEKNIFNCKTEFLLGFYGGTFLEIDTNLFSKILVFLNKVIKNKNFNGIRLSTTPESVINFQNKIRSLEKFNIDLIELGIQSFNEDVLINAGRKTKSSDIEKSIQILKQKNIDFAFQLIPGLPGEIFSDFFHLCREYFYKYSPNSIRIYPLLVLKNTKLSKMYENGEYKPLSLVQAINYSKMLYLLALKCDIKILKIGIHPEKSVFEDCISGPLSGHLKELIIGSIIIDFVEENIKKNVKKIEISVSKNLISALNADKKWLFRNYASENLKKKDIEINILNNFNYIELKMYGYNDMMLFSSFVEVENIYDISMNRMKIMEL